MIKAALFGDAFVRPSIIEEAVRRNLEPVVGPVACSLFELPYPSEPSRSNEEIREFCGTVEQMMASIGDAEVVINHMGPMPRSVIEALRSVRFIGCCRTEAVNINVAAATERGIPVVIAPGRNARAVAEFCVGLIIAECRNIARGHAALAEGVWRSDLYLYGTARNELAGQTIGLIGFGYIGRLMPGYMKAFGMRVLAYDPYVADEVFSQHGAERVRDMAELLSASDIVSLHARVTPETRGFIGETQFRQMKRGAYFINTARGPMVDYDALYRALVDGHLAGAGLETFGIEPPPSDWPLLRLPNVTLTPHIAGCSYQSVQNAAEYVARDLGNFYAGRPLENCANPAVMRRP